VIILDRRPSAEIDQECIRGYQESPRS
jgi:hypothetical protein